MALRQDQLIPDTAAGDRGYNNPNNLPIQLGQSAHENGLGNNPWDAQTNAQGLMGPNSSPTPYGPNIQGIKDIVNDISAYEQMEGGVNPNLKANPIYGYGSPALEYDFDEDKYPWSDELGDYAKPKDQDTLFWHFYWKGDDYAKLFDDMTEQVGQDDLARAFTLLRNANDWKHGQEAEEAAKRGRNRDLYGETLYNLLQETPQGQSLLNTIPENKFNSRNRNITGQGTGGYIK